MTYSNILNLWFASNNQISIICLKLSYVIQYDIFPKLKEDLVIIIEIYIWRIILDIFFLKRSIRR